MATVSDDLIRLYTSSDAVALGGHVRRKHISAAEAVEAAIAVIERLNPQLNAVIHRLYEWRAPRCRTCPGSPVRRRAIPAQGTGLDVAGRATDQLLRVDEGRPRPGNSEAIRRIKAAGFVLVGKSNAPENGWAITSEPKLYGATHNPWRADVTPGGSSGGAASAVAAGMVPLAEASDGAGSIRVPASCCGVVGLKPSRGRITIAPFGDYWYGGAYFFCVRVRFAIRQHISMRWPVHCPATRTRHPRRPSLGAVLATRAPERLRIGFTVTPPDGSPIDPEAVTAVRNAAALLERLGHEVEDKNMALDAASAWLDILPR